MMMPPDADASGAASLLVAALSATDAQQRYFLAGGLCASASHALATPIDVVKTRQQTVASYRELSLVEGLSRVAADEGPAALLTGIVPTVVGYGAEGAFKFGAYEALKPSAAATLVGLGLGADESASAGPICAAIVAGGLASLVLAPAEATRIRMVSDPQYSGLGLLGAASRLYDREGASGLLRGVPATCSKQLPCAVHARLESVACTLRVGCSAVAARSSCAAALLTCRGLASRKRRHGHEAGDV